MWPTEVGDFLELGNHPETLLNFLFLKSFKIKILKFQYSNKKNLLIILFFVFS